MKKVVVSILAFVLLAALAVPALADTMYTKKSVKVYQEPDKHSGVTLKLSAGHEVEVYNYANDFYECRYGWIQAKYLTRERVCNHSWGSWETVRKATCTKKGYKKRYCVKCGTAQDKDIPKTGHSWGKWKVTREATCTTQGTRTRTCQNCGEVEKDTYYAEHDYGPWEVIKEPTCTATGLRSHTCENCGREETVSVDLLPHDYEYKVIVEATDHSSGTRAQVCTVCGHTTDAVSYDPEGTLRRKDRGEEVRRVQQLLADQGYLNAGGVDGIFGGGMEKAIMKFQTDQGLEADGVAWPQTLKRLNHDFGPWETVKALTRTEPGERRRVCRDCGYVQTKTVEVGDVIERGSRGESVRAMQQILKQLGYDAGGFDGIYGQKLDNAFQKFESARGLDYNPGSVRPADVDALVSAWLEAGEPLTEGDAESPVNLALTVNGSTDEHSDSDVTTYNWSLTNLGSEKCMFNALLLTYGSDADFSGDDMVVVIDGEELRPNAGNSASGSFRVAESWGDGNLNFAAMAVSEKTGAKWLSNTVTFEAAGTDEPSTVEPLPVDINVLALIDGVYHAGFDRGDIARLASGIYMPAVHIFTVDTYDADAIDGLAAGDTVVVDGQAIAVNTAENRDGLMVVNGGMDAEDGCEFTPTEDGDAYRVLLYDDYATYTERGVAALVVDPNARFIDGWDIEKDPITVEYDGIVEAIQSSENDTFSPYNTTVTIENGRIIEINRVYVP